MNPIKTVFFDAGNTLLCPYPSVGTTMARIVNEAGFLHTAQDFDEHMPAFYDYYAHVYEQDESFWSEHERQQKMWVDGYSMVLKRAGIPPESIEEIVNDIYNAFDEAEAWKLFDGVEDTFAELKSQGIRIGIISNWGRGLDVILAGLGLAPYTDCVIASAEVGMHKPQPQIFEYALGQLDAHPSSSLHVGDHIIADVEGSARVGITPVLISHEEKTMFDPTTRSYAEGVQCISSVPEVLPIVSARML